MNKMTEVTKIPPPLRCPSSIESFTGSFKIEPALSVEHWLILMELNRTVRVKRDFSPNPEPPYVPEWFKDIIDKFYKNDPFRIRSRKIDRWGRDGVFYTHLLEMVTERPTFNNFSEEYYDQLVEAYGLDSGRDDLTKVVFRRYPSGFVTPESIYVRLRDSSGYTSQINTWVPSAFPQPGDSESYLVWDEMSLSSLSNLWLQFITEFLTQAGYTVSGEIIGHSETYLMNSNKFIATSGIMETIKIPNPNFVEQKIMGYRNRDDDDDDDDYDLMNLWSK